jgi:hypothetical protein
MTRGMRRRPRRWPLLGSVAAAWKMQLRKAIESN